MTDEFAAAGYIAIAPDLLSGKGPNGGGTKTMDANMVGQAIRDLPGRSDHGRPQCHCGLCAEAALGERQTLFVTGYCYGGGQSFRFATNRPDLKAAFVFYGPAARRRPLKRIKAPVYGSTAATTRASPPPSSRPRRR